MTSPITISTNLLAAIARWTSDDESRPSLQCVVFRDREVIACDGHRLVRAESFDNAPVRTPFGLHRHDIEAAAAAQRVIDTSRKSSLVVTGAGRTVSIALVSGGNPTLTVQARDVSDYPPLDQVMPKHDPTQRPEGYCLNAQFLAEAQEIHAASISGDIRNHPLRLTAWGRHDKDSKVLSDPILLENDFGIRMVIMPMRG